MKPTRPGRGGGVTGPPRPPERSGRSGRSGPLDTPGGSRQIKKPGPRPGNAVGRASAREAYYREQTRKHRLERRILENKYILVATVRREWGALALAVREKLLTLPTLLHQRGLLVPDGLERVEDAVHEILTEMAATR
jgi:hypothetical protein